MNDNEMKLEFLSKSCNEAFARITVAAFVSQLDPTIEELADIKTAVSEAVTNSIIHGYEDCEGIIKINTEGISNEAAQALANVYNKYSSEASNAFKIENADIQRQIKANEQLIEDEWDSMAESIGNYLQTSQSFTELNPELQNAFLSNLTNIDLSTIGDKYDGDVKQFLYSEFINPLSEMKPETQ